ncbi:spore wall synthesis complex protein [Actinocorallia lasiicapitis]
MPLSEHEQRLLDQIEHALYAEDPKFAHAVRTTNPQTHYKRQITKAALGLVLGIGVLMTGLVLNKGAVTVGVSVAGFLLMVASAFWAITSWKRMTGVGVEPDPRSARPARGKGRQSSSGGGLMGRLEERWRKRSEEQ